MKSVIEVYEEIAKKNPPWTSFEEKKCIDTLFKTNKERFINEAMKHNLGLVFSAVNKHSYVNNKEDVFQKAVLALVEALRTYDPTKGYKISTWVTNPIKWSVMQSQAAYSKDNTISGELSALNRKYNYGFSCVSMDSPVNGSSEPDGDTIADNITINTVNRNYVISRGLDTSNDIENLDYSSMVSVLFHEMSCFLTKNEVMAIKGILDGKNLTQISKDMNLSKVRLSQISKSAFTKIRKSNVGKKLRTVFESV